MEKRRSLEQYRAIDLTLFAVMLTVFESLVVTASVRWFPGQPYTVSLTPLITAVVLIRWGPWAGIHAVLGGALLCFLSHAAPMQFAVYIAGNLFSLLSLLFWKKGFKTEGSWKAGKKAMAFGLTVLLLMQAGRALLSWILGFPPAVVVGFFTTEVITDLFTLTAVWVVSRLDGMLEDQRRYLLRVQEEERARRGY